MRSRRSLVEWRESVVVVCMVGWDGRMGWWSGVGRSGEEWGGNQMYCEVRRPRKVGGGELNEVGAIGPARVDR